ncbi:hypothetical protein A1O7_06715 [Cladophialophora yegresii CBS 114405]|uniref:Kelch repeat-containing protein n=1 Tax=Cladophialophora yegresii CBS 114405 TaxID=1182544 RepID=W9VUL8_9EURO|nr:uncharacterized protein A1O7_06715 [Cladophialophora yegresii CBS 114405]EXJ59283.1 hypothetical protein A1O7_06715 [Cladophialophora yegresii CBS 114405]
MSSILQYGTWLLPFVSLVVANFTSNELASWNRPRAALIRDNVYLEGGWLQTGNWTSGAWDAKTLSPTDGLLFKLSMNRTFDITDNPAFFETIPEDAVQNFYLDGYMFADYDEFYAWGGMVLTSLDQRERTVSLPLYDAPEASNINLGVPNLNYDPQDGTFISVTNGGGANAPSEESAFYFGGLYNENGTDYDYFNPPKDQSPWLITVQMTDLGHATWIKAPLPENITWRAEGGLVWVPTSTQGILIAIGGVVKPADINFQVAQDNATQSLTFLKEFPVYDIGSTQWSLQPLNPTSQVPPAPLAQFCTTVASSADGTHHEIFVYGGWDSNGGNANDDVWILSVPSFTWIKAEPSGRKGAARTNHVCVQPYPDQMIVIGGTGSSEMPTTFNNSVDVFNLNTFTWTGTYDPTVHDDYKPNQAVLDVISVTPTASNIASAVSGWFTDTYDMTKVKSFGPFELQSTAPPTNSGSSTATPAPGPRGSDRDWVIPVAVVVPVVVVGALVGVLIFLCCRKARKARARAQEDGGPSEMAHNRKSWIVPWIYSTSSHAAPKDTATDSSVTEVEQGPHSPRAMTQTSPHELEGAGGYFRESDAGAPRERWSQSTQVRSPRYAYAGPVEGMNTEVHEVEGSARVSGPEDINYDIRNMAMYPPSVVSGGGMGQSPGIPSSSVSQSGDSFTPASPQSHSAVTSSGFAPIHEGKIAGGNEHTAGLARAISPIDSRRERPMHERKESDVSDIATSPFPSPRPETP